MDYTPKKDFYGSSSPVAALRSRFEQPTPFNSPVKALNIEKNKRSDTPRLNRFQQMNPAQASLGVFRDQAALTAPLATRPSLMVRRFLSEESVKKTGSAVNENASNGLMGPPLAQMKGNTTAPDMKRKFNSLEVKPLPEAGQEAIMMELETDMAALKSEVGDLVDQRMAQMWKKVESRLAQA